MNQKFICFLSTEFYLRQLNIVSFFLFFFFNTDHLWQCYPKTKTHTDTETMRPQFLLQDFNPESGSVQFSLSVIFNSVTPWMTAHQVSLFITNSQSLLKLMSIKSVIPSNHLNLCIPLLLLPSPFPASWAFLMISSSYQVTKALEFQLQHPSFQ